MSRTLPQRAATGLLETISHRLWDLKANLMVDIVDQHGSAGAVAWFARNMPTYEKILREWGPLRTHYLAVAISAINGCAYCTYGHAYAFVLHYYELHGVVFPLNEDELRDLGQLEQPEIEKRLRDALGQADMADEIDMLDRTISRIDADSAPTPAERDEKWIDHLVQMFGWLNACGIQANTTPDAAHDPINKDDLLKRRYANARAAAAE